MIDPRTIGNLDQCEAFDGLRNAARADLAAQLTGELVTLRDVDAGGGMRFNYAARPVNPDILELLSSLSDQQRVHDQFRALYEGYAMNVGEDRKVLHHLLRGRLGSSVSESGRDIGAFYREQTERVAAFARAVHDGEVTGSTGKRLKTVIQIGIGGSDLGPRALAIALEGHATRRHGHPRMRARF
ncbi:MAG: glucose-6-phosphate isomerase, partial [Spirochaetia bacterium]